MSVYNNSAEVEDLICRIKRDNRGNLDFLPFGEDVLRLVLKYAQPKDEDDELRKLFKNPKNERWDSINVPKEDKDYPHFFIFELCKWNYNVYGISDCPKRFIEIVCLSMGDMAKKIAEEMISWHKKNSKNNMDLIKFILDNPYFIKKCSGFIERLTTNIWEVLNEKEKQIFAYSLLSSFSLQDTELEKYYDSYVMEQLKIEPRIRQMTFDGTISESDRNTFKEQYNGTLEGDTLIYQTGRLEFGIEFFREATQKEDEAVNKFVRRKIGYPLFIKDNIGEEEFIDYTINVESNKSQSNKLDDINTDTDVDFIWKIIYSLHSDYRIYEKAKKVFFKRDDLVEKIENAKIQFSEKIGNKIIFGKIKLLMFIKSEKAFYKAFEMLKKISNDEDIFPKLNELDFDGYETVLTDCRKLQINKLLKKGTLQPKEADKFIAMAENKETNYYAWSEEEIKKCLLPKANLEEFLEKLYASLEPELMVRIFEILILSLVKHRSDNSFPSLEQLQVLYPIRILNKSYADRPSIWAKHLIKIAEEWKGSEDMLIRICFALGDLREPLGGKVPISLQKIANKPEYSSIKDEILIQRNLFNRENLNRGHHKNPFKRVELCKEQLTDGVREAGRAYKQG